MRRATNRARRATDQPTPRAAHRTPRTAIGAGAVAGAADAAPPTSLRRSSTYSHQAFGQWRRHQPDGQYSLPSTALGPVSATERSPMSPPRPWVSVGTIHDQNASGWHLATGVVERVIRELIIEISRVGPWSRRGVLSTIMMEPLKIRIDPVPLGASQIPKHKPPRITPPRRFR